MLSLQKADHGSASHFCRFAQFTVSGVVTHRDLRAIARPSFGPETGGIGLLHPTLFAEDPRDRVDQYIHLEWLLEKDGRVLVEEAHLDFLR